MTTETVWINNHVFDSTFEGNTFRIDGDKKEGPGPKSLLLSGLAGCSGIDVVDILEKMRVNFSGLSIKVNTEQTEEHPKVFKDIEIEYQLHTAAENEDKVRKAIELSLNKYCGVAAMLQKNSTIRYTLVLLP